MAHERLHRDEQVSGSSNRSFGLVFAVVFGLLGGVPFFTHGHVRTWALVVAGIFLVVALLLPAVLAPLNRLWTKLGLLLHRITSPLVLGLLFFVVIAPMGFAMRLLGKDPLRLKRDPKAASYWVDRQPPGPAAESFVDQF